MKKTAISVIGLGLMGSAVAATLQAAGCSVTGWNRTEKDNDKLSSAGVAIASTAADAIRSGEIILILTKDYKSSEPLFAPVETLAEKFVVQMTTGSPEDALAFAAWIRQRGGLYLDVAIKRGPIDFGSDRGAMFFSGTRSAFETIEPTLKLLGGRLVFLGENDGAAKALDLAAFARSYCWLFGYFQAVAIAREYGLSVGDATEQMLSVVSSTYRFIEKSVPEIESDIFAPAVSASVLTHYSALSRTVDAAESGGFNTPLLHVIKSYMEETISAGLGDREIAACFRAVSQDRANRK